MSVNEELQLIGRDLVLGAVSVLRTVQSHGADNQAARTSLDRLRTLIDLQLGTLGTLQLNVVDDMLLLNGTRLRAASTQAAQYSALANELVLRGIGGIAIRQAVTTEALRAFFVLLAPRPESAEAVAARRDEIFRHAPPGIEPLELRTLSTSNARDVLRPGTMAFTLATYVRVILAFREFVAALKEGRNPYANRLSVVRVVQDLVDSVHSRADLVLYAMQLEKARGAISGLGYNEVHAANTCVYAVLIGRMLELERTSLLDLGTSALLADAGSAMLLDGQANTSAVLTAEQRAQLQVEATRAVQALLGESQGNDDAALLRVIVAYEHRRPVMSPAGASDGPLHVLSRIVAVAGAYDAMTTDRPWRPAMSMKHALDTLTRESGTKFDPLIVGTLHAVLITYFGDPNASAA